MRQHRVRTYLDPDAVGPLPRSLFADDSDALSAARTLLRLPDSPTQEISANDFIDVADSNQPLRSSVAPEDAFLLPTRRLGPRLAVLLATALGAVVLGVALGGTPRPPEVVGARSAGGSAGGGPTRTEAAGAAATSSGSEQRLSGTRLERLAPMPASAPTVGTLRLDASLEGQRIFLDGVALSATAAILRCGPHDVAVGSPGRSRSIDVPCGGEVTIFR